MRAVIYACYFFGLFFSILSLADDFYLEKAKFAYKGKAIILNISNNRVYEKKVSEKYGGKVSALDAVRINNLDVWVGNFEVDDSTFSKLGIFYFDGKLIHRVVDVRLGFFILHNGNYYVSVEDLSDPHTVVSILYKLKIVDNDKLTAKEIYRLPGDLSNFNSDHDKLIVSGYVNTLPFALSINADGIWSELRRVESREKTNRSRSNKEKQ